MLINPTVITAVMRSQLTDSNARQAYAAESPMPRIVGLFLLFLGYTQAYVRHQSPLLLKEALLVGFLLAGLVVSGGLQQWWLQPMISSLEPTALFLGALGLAAFTDNAALT